MQYRFSVESYTVHKIFILLFGVLSYLIVIQVSTTRGQTLPVEAVMLPYGGGSVAVKMQFKKKALTLWMFVF